jgi:hypothetical protein
MSGMKVLTYRIAGRADGPTSGEVQGAIGLSRQGDILSQAGSERQWRREKV